MVTAGGDGLITILFWGVVFVIGAIASAAKKKRQEREALETQEQLRRVDAAIQAARQRPQPAPAAPQFIEVVEEPSAAYAAAPQVLEVASPAFLPATFAGTPAAAPVELQVHAEGPARPGEWEAARSAVPANLKKSSPPTVESGFAPPTPAELREAIVWREAFVPCKAMRSRPW